MSAVPSPISNTTQQDPLREFLTELEASDELVRIDSEVDAKYEICAYLRHIADAEGPAVVFERIKGYSMPALANLFGTEKRIAMALGVELSDMNRIVGERLRKRIPPVLVDHKDAPCKQVVTTGKDVDLSKIPFPL